ncbi:TonB-dependent receptor [Parapedobacter koreensis]|uniref:TonB-dependent receptor n=1 Tax=Parapedobacter koreensis TaxID=332977 RepID=A0A1H7FDV0_9SPHI|nr:TonB-dependent receptor [Parapedobacter koreensis]SEK22582.1 TonB-dependent receptor [Parapedobacter koreensis]
MKITCTNLIAFFCLLFTASTAFAGNISGRISDSANGELLVGARVSLRGATGGGMLFETASGLNGRFVFNDVPDGTYVVTVAYVGYESATDRVEIAAGSVGVELDIALNADQSMLDEVMILGEGRGTDAHARSLERLSPTVMNVISAKQIQLSPDITVANVIQRVSGLSIERNASGDPQYAIVRGMDKRYNNTLVNGIKIPSPDNENRFVPLDIFPAVFLERLEVYKSLTANMEADAIGGTVNMVMKSAPATFLLDADIQVGYNQANFDQDFMTYDRSGVNRLSPKEIHGDTYRATPDDFPVENLILDNKQALPDIFANVTYGDRFVKDKLGIMLGGSFQNSYRPVTNYFYDPAVDGTREGNPLLMRELIERNISSQLQRIAFHGKLDYHLNDRHGFSFYAGKYLLNEFRVRDQLRQENFVSTTTNSVYPLTRTSNIYQDITTLDLRGNHDFTEKLRFDWSAIYSLAENDRPDDAVFARAGQLNLETREVTNEIVYFQGTRNSRTWERNQDNDLSLYLNLTYKPEIINDKTTFQIGGVIRNKERDNYFNFYNYSQIFGQYRGVDWDDFGDVEFGTMANPLGSGDRSNLVYDAYEDIYAGYINTSWALDRTEIQVGLRAEQTIQGYAINAQAASSNDIELEQEQNYLDFFPSLSVKYLLNTRTNLKATYFKGISRPGFYEIVPTVRQAGGGDSFYSEMGNADLRPTIGHSADLRYEYFPSAIDQLLVGVFYKRLIDPIEYGFRQASNETEQPSLNRILPQNFENATNFGVELDATKYFNKFGVRLNYTYTNSRITANKFVYENRTASLVSQTRPLQGQSAHIGNVSLLFKDQKRALDAQLVLNYTGERIAVVSPFLGADHLMRPMTQLDLSIEKGFKRFVVFVKANNLLNTPYELFVEKPLAVPTDPYPYQEDPYNRADVRRDSYGQSYRLGVRYTL